MEIEKPIQIIYASGTFGNCVRWMFDRFSKDSNFKHADSPWDDDNRAHGFREIDYNKKFTKGHQLSIAEYSPDPEADKVVLSFDPKDILFIERCGFYRNPGWENEKNRYKNIIALADNNFVKETFGSALSSKSVAKELYKIQFHDMSTQVWWNAMDNYLTNQDHHKFDMYSLWNHDQLVNQLQKVSERYKLNFDIEEKVIHNVVEKIKKSYPVITKDRAHQVLDAIDCKKNIDCNQLDILEQAYIEAELEKIQPHSLIFPYGTNWFEDTDQINEFLNTYPKYIRHMNPRLPWHKNHKNPFYLTGRIDKSK